MKYFLLGATIINCVIGTYNILFASIMWSIFNFMAAAACLYSYLDVRD